jgi:hypothetical protein
MTPEQYMRGQDAQHEPSDSDFLENCGLDAYGHMEWTVGNEDWVACLDAVLSPEMERIAYHVVVDCESGGFTDTTESGVVRIDDADAIQYLKSLPGRYADSCIEFYPGQVPEDDEAYAGPIEWEETDKRWSAHLDALIRQAEEAK